MQRISHHGKFYKFLFLIDDTTFIFQNSLKWTIKMKNIRMYATYL